MRLLQTGIIALLVLLCAAQPGWAATTTRVYLPVLLSPAPVLLLAGVNDYRASNNRPALADNAQLDAAAQGHADDMVARAFFSHTGSNGSQPWDRVTSAGYTWSVVAENLALDTTCGTAVGLWAASAGHRTNMLGNYAEAGAGEGRSGNSSYCVLVLATPR